jgi:hypothetical protein
MCNRYHLLTRRHTPGHGSRIRATLLILLAWLSCAQALAGTLEAQIDRTRIVQGETVTLQLSVPGDIQGDPDLSPLERDFEILSRSEGSRINIINGRSSATRNWQLVLLPKRDGDLTIPALQLGSLQSRPLPLSVMPAAAARTGAAGTAGQPVLIEVEADPEHPYVQGEVTYRVRILSRVPLHEASLSEPHAGDAIIEQAGEDSHDTTQRDGITYQVIERHYVIFPQHSGPLQIDGPTLDAAVPVQNGGHRGLRQRFFGNDPFPDIEKFFGSAPFADFPDIGSMFTQTRPVHTRGRDITLDVLPQPAGIQGDWLPAKSLSLAEAWSPDPPVFRVGEPVTRTIALIVDGLSAAQLPELTPPPATGMKAYPDQPQSETRAEGDSLITTRTLKTALIPMAPGSVTLPEFQVHWWDTEAQQARVATLPARTIEVLPARAGAGPAAAAGVPASATRNATAPAAAGASGIPADAPALQPEPQQSYWPWLAAAAAIGWLVTLGLWRFNSGRGRSGARKPVPAADTAPSRRRQLAQCRMRLKNACLSNDPRAARAALLDWAAVQWPAAPPRDLSALASHISSAAAQGEIITLDRRLYAGETRPGWDSRTAWPVLEQALRQAAPGDDAGTEEPLPDLYPRHVPGS